MTPSDLRARLPGVMAFATTPFREDESLDHARLEQHIDRLARSGASSIVVAGGAGEFYALAPDEHRDLVRTAVGACGGRVPVIAGIGHTTGIATGLACEAALAGADGILVMPPYFIEPDITGVRHHYQHIVERAGLPALIFRAALYPMPLGHLAELAEVELIIGVKDEVGDVDAFLQAREQIGDRFLWINGLGETHAAAYFASGADGLTSGVINFAPSVTLATWQACLSQDMARVREIVATKIRPIANWRRRRPGYGITVVKEAMNLMGLPGGNVRLPLVPLTPQERLELGDTLRGIGLELKE